MYSLNSYNFGKLLETVISICNALEIKLDELAFKEEVDTNIETTNNPFSTDVLYMHYIDNTDKLYEMKLEIKAEDGIMKVYFKVPSLNDKIFFVGSIESNSDVAFIMLRQNLTQSINTLKKL